MPTEGGAPPTGAIPANTLNLALLSSAVSVTVYCTYTVRTNRGADDTEAVTA